MTTLQTLKSWLNDAHAMEYSAADLLRRYANDVEAYPDIQNKFTEMAALAEQKMQRIEEFIKKIGEDTSGTKDVIGKIGSMWQSATSELMYDQIVKHMLIVYSSIHLGIASYLSLAAAAHGLKEDGVVTFAEESIRMARDMSRWFEERIPKLTSDFLHEVEQTA